MNTLWMVTGEWIEGTEVFGIYDDFEVAKQVAESLGFLPQLSDRALADLYDYHVTPYPLNTLVDDMHKHNNTIEVVERKD